MYLLIGKNHLIPIRDIVVLCKAHRSRALKTNGWEHFSRPYIALADAGSVRSFVVTEDCVYGSPLTLETLVARYKRSFATRAVNGV